MASNVTYIKKYCKPAQELKYLKLTEQGSDVISETISLKYEIVFDQYAPRPIDTIRLTIKSGNPAIYQIVNEGSKMDIDYKNKSSNFLTGMILLKIKLVDSTQPLEKKVKLSVTVKDVDQNISFPTDNNRFYQWIPVIELLGQKSPKEILC